MTYNYLLLVSIFTIILKFFKNYSNFSDYIIIPLISSISVKYFLGDLDVGYQWTLSDIIYWVSLYVTSFLVLKLISFLQIRNV